MRELSRMGGIEKFMVFVVGAFFCICLLSYAMTCERVEVWDLDVQIVGVETDQVSGPLTVSDGGSTNLIASYMGGGCPLMEVYVDGESVEVPSPAPSYEEGVRLYFPAFVYGPVTEDLEIIFVFEGCG